MIITSLDFSPDAKHLYVAVGTGKHIRLLIKKTVLLRKLLVAMWTGIVGKIQSTQISGWTGGEALVPPSGPRLSIHIPLKSGASLQ